MVSFFGVQLIYFMAILVTQLKCYNLITYLSIQITFHLSEVIKQVSFYTFFFNSIKKRVKCSCVENKSISLRNSGLLFGSYPEDCYSISNVWEICISETSEVYFMVLPFILGVNVQLKKKFCLLQ